MKTKDDTDKAMILAEFFSLVFTEELEGEIPTLNIKDVPELSQIEFACEDICRIIDKLQRDKSPSLEGFHPCVIKEVKNAIAYPLRLVLNLSLQKNKLPED